MKCQHPKCDPGPRVPARWGSWATEVCAQCGAWRYLNRKGSRFRPAAELAEVLREEEDS